MNKHNVSALISLAILITLNSSGRNSSIDTQRGAETIGPVTPQRFDGDVRQLPPAAGWNPGIPVKEIPRQITGETSPTAGPPANPTEPGADPLLDRQAARAAARQVNPFPDPLLNIAGHDFTGAFPPDTIGDIGKNHYIQMVNSSGGSSFMIFDKSTGAVVAGPTTLSTLAAAVGGPCAVGRGDPVVLYDHLADRWLMSEFADPSIAGVNALCVYISRTDDPVTGGWDVYCFETKNFPDYPKYAVWPDAYYVSTNEAQPAAYALDRQSMLNGQPATMQRFFTDRLAGFGFQALIPGDLDGAAPPPIGSPNYFIRHRDDEAHDPGVNDPTRDFLEIWKFHADFTDPANSAFTGPLMVPISEFDSDLCGLFSFDCFPQPDPSAPTLDPLREVVMWRLQYRNFGAYETLVGNFVTDVDGGDHGGIRWFELRKDANSDWSLFQEGTFAPDGHNRWMGSIAMDGDGNIALGYSVGSDTLAAGIRLTGRFANDAPGVMTLDEFNVIDGMGSQQDATRWGEYSSMNVDPDDDRTFWYTNEYATAEGVWDTRIVSFIFVPTFSLSGSDPVQSVCAPGELTDITVDTGSLLGFANPVTLSLTGLPAGITGGFSTNPVTPGGQSIVSIDIDGTVAPGDYTFQITGSAADANDRQITVKVSVFNAVPTTPAPQAPLNGSFGQLLMPTLVWDDIEQAESYTVEIDDDPSFATIDDTATVSSSTYTLASRLNPGTTYSWRVRADNPCGPSGNSTVFSFTTISEIISADFSNSSGAPDTEGFSSSGINDQWHLSTGRGTDSGHSPDDSYYFGEGEAADGGGSYVDFASGELVSPEIILGGVVSQPIVLEFNHFLQIEDFFDHADVVILGDDGETVIAGSNSDAVLLPDSTNGFEPVSMDISGFIGQIIRVGFRLQSDFTATFEGWYVDDVLVLADLPVATNVGSVEFDADNYEIGDRIIISLIDSGLSGAGFMNVDVITSGGDSEMIQLRELATGGIFTGYIETNSTVVNAADGVLQLSPGVVITVTYNDADDGLGNAAVVTDTAQILAFAGNVSFQADFYLVGEVAMLLLVDRDLTGQETYSVIVDSSRGDNETVTVVEVAAGVFEGGILLGKSSLSGDNILDAAVGDTITVTYTDADTGAGTNVGVTNTVSIRNLVTLFSADFSDAFGNPKSDGFTTTGEAENEWHLSTGRGFDSGHSPAASFYFGSGEGPRGGGLYMDNATGSLLSPEFDLTGLGAAQVSLAFNHFLAVEAGYDFASVNVIDESGDTTEIVSSKNSTIPSVTNGFEPVAVDISTFTGQSIVVEFAMVTDYSVTFEGWYMDDVTITAVVEAGPITNASSGNGINNGVADEFRLVLDGSDLQIFTNDILTQVLNAGQTTNLVFNGSKDDDTLTIDFSGGNPIPPGGIVFNAEGNGGNNDTLRLIEGAVDTVTHDFEDIDDGVVEIGVASRIFTIRYTELDAVVDILTADERAFNFSNADDFITLDDNGNMADDDISQIVGDNSVPVVFSAPATVLSIMTADGNDTIDLPWFIAKGSPISIDGGGGSDDIDTLYFDAAGLDIISADGFLGAAGRGEIMFNNIVYRNIEDAGIDAKSVVVPTLTEWGVVALVMILAGAAFVRVRRPEMTN